MTPTFPPSSSISSNNRPAYLDNLFRDASLSPSSSFSSTPHHHTSPSLHSSTSSISCSSTASSYDLRSAFLATRPLSPVQAGQQTMDDQFSLHSSSTKKHRMLNPRHFRFGRIFSTRRPSAGDEDALESSLPPPPTNSSMMNTVPAPRRPSLSRLQTSFPPPRGASTYAKKPLPAVPQPSARAQELSCRRCYYVNARNCHGWVMGGTNGDACETCLQAGFFGEK